jgi:aspartyl-tRNA(Asn)/glutamyl-tRNA(Gln) amidotransferase subunit A
VPIAVKDLIDVRGHATRAGSRVTEDRPATVDAPAVQRLRTAGALILGKTATHEFAHGVTTPPTRNPWDLSRIPGGSSGGSAAAVAAGECAAALGSDTGGSIRVPAALCGVSGLRPARGDVPAGGCVPFSARLDTVGPMAADARDLALLFEVLAGVSCTLDPDLTGLRDRGWYPARRDRYSEEVASYLAHAESITADARDAAATELERLEAELRAGLAGVDVLALPTTAITAPPVAEAEVRADGHGRAPIVGTLMRLCGPFSWCGMAAVSVPCGLTAAGLPIGLQLVGRDVPTVLSVAARFQELTEHVRSPTLPEPVARA